MPRNRGGDPYWLTARFNSKCGKPGCEQTIAKGDQAFYYPSSRTILAKPCGHADTASADFEAHRADEAMMSGGY